MDKYLEYDELTGEYVITHEAVIEFIDAQPAEITAHFDNEKKAYRALSQAVYRIIYDRSLDANRHNHIKFMQGKIHRNLENEKLYLMKAMIEIIKGALNSDMDLNAYIDGEAKHYPNTVEQELQNGLLIMPGRKELPDGV